MVISRGDETDLVLPLHDGVHETVLWGTFQQRLRRRVRADTSAIVVDDGAGAARWLVAPAGTTAPPLPEEQRLRPGRVYAVEAPGFGRMVRVEEPGGASACLIIYREGADFTAADGALLARLAPHLATALRTLAALDRQRDAAGVAAAALRRAGVGWAGFAADGRLLALSEDAAAMPEVARPAGAVTAAVGTCVDSGAWQLLDLGHRTPLWMLLVPVAASDVVATVPTRVLGLLRLPNGSDVAQQAEVLRDLFALAPSEARLAAMIMHGASIAEAAQVLGLTIETARNYAKRVFTKTGTHGQVDLIRTMMASVAPLA